MKKLPIVAIVGRPNVGKSSLFNRIIGRRQAVVAEEAGTTRDSVQSLAEWNGKQFWLVDTAGLQAAKDPLAKDVQAQIGEARAVADVIVLVVDAATIPTADDRKSAKLALKSGRPVLLAVNKIDGTANRTPAVFSKLGIKQIVGVSAIHGTNSGDLLDEISSQLPKRKSKAITAPAIALLGRPNVGKSSIFNGLAGTSRAIVSDVSGTTRDVNRTAITVKKKRYDILDTAGIRRPGRAAGIEKLSILRTLQAVNECDVAVVVLDATELAVALDQKIAGMVSEAGKGLIVAVNKWDLIEDKEKVQKQIETQLYRTLPFVWWAPMVLTSAESGHNVIKLIDIAEGIMQRRQTEIKTSELNRYLTQAVGKHPPAGLKNRHPKLRYVTQTGSQPPQFTFFGTQLDFLHWSYKRYLDKLLREQFDFSGTPLKLLFRNK